MVGSGFVKFSDRDKSIVPQTSKIIAKNKKTYDIFQLLINVLKVLKFKVNKLLRKI